MTQEEIRTEYYVAGTEPAHTCSHYDEGHVGNLLLEPGAKPQARAQRGGVWGWFKRFFR